QNFDAGEFLAELLHVLLAKHLMHAAVPLPENDLAGLDRFRRVAAEIVRIRIEHWHLLVRDPHLEGRVSPQVLIREEEDAAGSLEGPLEDRFGVAAGADDAAMPAAESFQAGG